MTLSASFSGRTRDVPGRLGPFTPLRRGAATWLRNARERRLLARLSRLSPHLILDMGFDPEAVYAALEGTWDEVSGFRDRRP